MRYSSIYQEVAEEYTALDFTTLYGKCLLITGATGLVGSYLAETIRWLNTERNANIRLYIVSHSGMPSHLCELEQDSHTTVLSGDLSDSNWRKTLPSADYIIHAAGYGQPGKFTAAPEKTIALNTSATADLLEKLTPGGKFLFISTSEVYSGLDKDAYQETDIGTTTPQHPRACYIEGKRCGEAICMAYRAKGVEAKCARLALAYGPGTRSDDRRVLNEFIKKGIQNHEIRLMDSGTARRTYCYVTDAVEAMWNILLRGTEPVYNVGGHSEISIRDLAKNIGNILSVPISVPAETAEMSGAPKSVCMNLEKVEREFEKTLYVDLQDGLHRTIDWQLRNLYSNWIF